MRPVGYEAKGKSILRNHQHVFHERKRFNCDKCDFQSYSKGHLKNHKVHIQTLLCHLNGENVTGQLVKKHGKESICRQLQESKDNQLEICSGSCYLAPAGSKRNTQAESEGYNNCNTQAECSDCITQAQGRGYTNCNMQDECQGYTNCNTPAECSDCITQAQGQGYTNCSMQDECQGYTNWNTQAEYHGNA